MTDEDYEPRYAESHQMIAQPRREREHVKQAILVLERIPAGNVVDSCR